MGHFALLPKPFNTPHPLTYFTPRTIQSLASLPELTQMRDVTC